MIRSKIYVANGCSFSLHCSCIIRCHLDFGSANPLGMAPHSLYLKVTNDTAIPTTLVAAVTNFPSGLIKADQSMRSDDNTLLNVTTNLADPNSMSDKTSKSGELENFGLANVM